MSHVLQAFYSRAWAIEENAYATIEQILLARAHGARPPESELEAWEAASPYGAQGQQAQQGDMVAVIPVHGVMLGNASGLQRLSGATDARDLAASIRAAADDPSVREIVLDVDSPGGEVTAIDAPTNAIAYARDRKPVTAVSQGMMASAAYWLASQADRIVASPNAMVGSIGVLYTHVDRSQANENEGVKVTILRSAERKALINNPNEPFGDEAKAEAARMIGTYHQAFVDAVASGRDRSPEWVQANWADGRVEVGTTAHQLGMVDQLGTLADVLTTIENEANATHAHAHVRAEGSSVVKLEDVTKILREGTRTGAETDDPEGSRVMEISDTLANQMAASLEETSKEHQAEIEKARTEATATRRRSMAADALGQANLPPVSTERDAAFAAELADAAVNAESDEAAKQVVDERIEARRADLQATRDDNSPNLPARKADARAQESKRALASIRRGAGLSN